MSVRKENIISIQRKKLANTMYWFVNTLILYSVKGSTQYVNK